ncbi:MAG: 3-oxoacyl-ACP reductase FabG [Chloroflexi bacterium]|nr:3-oxoacyl-ACP reductase FabG [Chloroflexota bacterium]
MFNLDNKIALITGGGRGLGRAIALAFADAGANVAVASRSRDQLDEVVDAIRAKDRRALAVECDVSESASVAQMVNATRAEFGRIDILVNSAGVAYPEKITDVSDATWDWIIKTNLTGAFYACRDVARVMIEQKSGCIINIASVAGAKGPPGLGAYAASKGGLIAFTRVLALENTRHNIRANVIAPGYFRTDMNSAALDDPDIGPKIVGRIPMRRAGKPEEIGGLAIYLASDAASFVTGEVFFISGGEMAQ